eukprot:TRINITY_DN4634_c0_g2_i1.p1 TRINITY_DN4634_c0_g2~~TRINITY_DN4634_c0_g2_i1.p1  ORF type:complete len:296 (-),score=57.69 TRINITY_DN4634_c0_g2_i1:11-898(-)
MCYNKEAECAPAKMKTPFKEAMQEVLGRMFPLDADSPLLVKTFFEGIPGIILAPPHRVLNLPLGPRPLPINRTLCDTLEHANPTIFTPEAKSAWSNVLTKISTLMYNAGKVHKSLVLKTTVFRKLQKNSQWKKSVLSLSLDTLYLYQDETSSKLRSTFQLTDVTSIYRNFVSTVTCSSETSTTSSNPSPPLSPTSSGVTHSHSSSETASPVMQFPDLSPPSTHPFSLGICLTKSQYKTPHFYVSFQTREEALTWMEELEWRLQATSKSKSEEKNSAKKKKKGMSSKMVSSLLIKT